MSTKDLLSNEVAISAELTENGLKASATSRAIAGLDRLCGNAFDVLSAKIEAKTNRTRATSAAEVALIEAENDAAVEIIKNKAEYGNRALKNFIIEQERKQNNKDAIAAETMELLRLPKPEDAIDIQGDLNEDWLNAFDKYAQDASTERFKKLWAQVLAGEIRKPQSFSLTTLRFMSELDAKIAALFEKAISRSSTESYIVKPKDLKNQELLDYTFLEDVGLLSQVNGYLSRPLEKQVDDFYYLFNGNFALKIKSASNVSVLVIRITRVGEEIAKILPKIDDKLFLQDAAEVILDQVDSIELNSALKISTNIYNSTNTYELAPIKNIK